MKLLVGLGNPGIKYQLTRHNVGFLLVDTAAESWSGGRQFKSEHKAQVLKTQAHGQAILLAKPQTFMNLSGESVQSLTSYYQIALPDLLVVQDEVDIPFGALRFHICRSPAGHNGIKSIHQHLGTDNYARLKMGLGRPIHPQMPVADFVLQNFSDEEQSRLPDFLHLALEAVEYFMKFGIEKAANKFNSLAVSS